MSSKRLSTATLVLSGALGVRGDVPFMTELDIFSQLAPCVTNAVTNAYLWEQDTTACGSEPTKLQSCICTNSAELNKMTVSISSAISSRCGSLASDDQSSAASLVDKYCHPDKTITFSTPTTNIIPGLMSDIAAISSLPPCVQSGLSAAVGAAAYDGCPTVDNMWAPCVCGKKNIVDVINSSLGPEVRQSCSNADDMTLASKFYTQFCAMNEGTTSFDALPGPPGDMTYYITALPQFTSLRGCAQSGVIEAVMSQSSYLCPAGPQALASCICLKQGMLGKASQSLTSSVKYNCDNTALVDVASAADVLDYYCQAVQKKVVATVAQSISETKATTLGQSTRPSSTGSGMPKNTSAAGSSKDPKDSKNGSGGGLSKGAIIAIAVLASLVGIGLIAFVAIFVRRRNRKANASDGVNTSTEKPPYPLHSELATTSPSSEMDGKSPYVPPTVSEVAATPRPYQQPRTELSGTSQPQLHQAVSPSNLNRPNYQPNQGLNNPYNPHQNWQPPAQTMYELESPSSDPHVK